MINASFGRGDPERIGEMELFLEMGTKLHKLSIYRGESVPFAGGFRLAVTKWAWPGVLSHFRRHFTVKNGVFRDIIEMGEK